MPDEPLLPPLPWGHGQRRGGGHDERREAIEGLRERKKRQTRQQISDTATALFLERGFDHVRVSEVAAACGVSEKTVFNYFPTKESLMLDREESAAADLRRVLGPGGAATSPVQATVALLDADARAVDANMMAWTTNARATGARYLDGIQRFAAMVDATPSLRAAQMDMMDRLAQVAAEAMAARAGVNPEDPEPQIAGTALLGLWRIYFRAMQRHADTDPPPESIRDDVMAEVHRAARLIDTGLWSFASVVQGARSRDQLHQAAQASDEARKQVLLAIRQARTAWRLLAAGAPGDRRHPAGPGTDRRSRT